MARIVVMGGGVAGHTAATFAKKWLGKEHEVVVVTPNANWNWIPSNIWVGVGRMKKEDVIFPLAPVYEKAGIIYKQAKAVSIHPEGKEESDTPYITIEYTALDKRGQTEEVTYDYLINATGPRLDFDATQGLGDGKGGLGKHTVSVCSAEHALHASNALRTVFERARKGERQRIVVGTGHGTCTCQGAAFEYLFNIDHEARKAGVRDLIDLRWISNEPYLGDFGMGGMHLKTGGYVAHSKLLTESLFAEKNIDWITEAHTSHIEEGKLRYTLTNGTQGELTFDFAMLIPPFKGAKLQALDKKGNDITDTLFAPNGFMKVDADYTQKPFEEWKASDWPSIYQSPAYDNIFAAGIAFAPPHPISKPQKTPQGDPVTPAPPRTGMPSAIIGKTVAKTICDKIKYGNDTKPHTASMARMGAACVASMGKGVLDGTAMTMTVYPVVPDFETYPETGRDIDHTFGDVGLAGHWIKHILHHMFIYKAKLKPGWSLIPE